MNTLVADSGSTKTEWILLENSAVKGRYYSGGLNPYFMTLQQLIEVIDEKVESELKDVIVNNVFFYGAGCGSDKNKKKIRKALSASFEGAEIQVDSDLLGAAIACFGNEPGVACILGTGSNTCLFDGKKIINQIPSLGFTLGDEGSGGYFGKKIIHAYFYKDMPEELKKVLDNKYDMDLSKILDNVYQKPNPNRFVASFSFILGEYKDHPFVKEIVRKGFTDFVENQLGYFDDLSNQKIGFIGSIAAIHQDILTEVLKENGLTPHIIIQKPIDRLVEMYKLKVDNLI